MTGARRIFVSYRREDSSGHAGRLYDRLVERFGNDRVFMDIDAIRPGTDFAEMIDAALEDCIVLLAIIGRRWLTSLDARADRRLVSSDDFVRLEVETALDRGIPVIPLLVQGAEMPAQDELPESLSRLARRQALEISDRRWQTDVGILIAELERLGREVEAQEQRHGETQTGSTVHSKGGTQAHDALETLSTDDRNSAARDRFKLLSQRLVDSSLRERRKGAQAIARVSKDLSLEDLLAFGSSTRGRERVGAAIGLRVKLRDEPELGRDERISPLIQRLLSDPLSWARYRAAEAARASRHLSSSLQADLALASESDDNVYVREQARKALEHLK